MKLTKAVTAAPIIEPMLPLINIIFLLLIFFMVSAHIATPINGVSIPYQSQENPLANENTAQNKWLFVSKGGDLTYQKNAISLSSLASTFSQNKALSLLADSDTTTGTLEKIANELSKAGVENIRLVTQLSIPNKEGES